MNMSEARNARNVETGAIWTTKAGLKAIVLQHPSMGHHCGYVAVPEGHPLFGKGYDDAGDIDVHGGLTFADGNGKYPAEGSGLWWFGYDCAHAGDTVPGLHFSNPYREETFKDLPFCINECEKLAEQLKQP
jgi:hypothetical protein